MGNQNAVEKSINFWLRGGHRVEPPQFSLASTRRRFMEIRLLRRSLEFAVRRWTKIGVDFEELTSDERAQNISELHMAAISSEADIA
jgi:hypothetical protein